MPHSSGHTFSQWSQGGGIPNPQRGGCYLVDVVGFSGTVQRWIDITSGTSWYMPVDDPTGLIDIIDEDVGQHPLITAAIADIIGQPVGTENADSTAKVIDCAEVIGGCGQKIAIGNPKGVGTPLLWVDAGDKGTMFDASGDPTPVNLSAGTGPGYNFGLPSWSGSFSGQLRTAFDKSGNDYHLMVPPGSALPQLVTFEDGQIAPLETWERATYIHMRESANRHLVHGLNTTINAQTAAELATGDYDFDLYMVISVDQHQPEDFASLFASTNNNPTGLGAPTNNGSFQISRNRNSNTIGYLWKDGGNQKFISGPNLSELMGQWSVLRVSNNKGRIRIYLNGVQRGTAVIDRIYFTCLSLAMNRAGNSGLPTKFAEVVMFQGEPLGVVEGARLNDYLTCKWLHGKMV